MPAKRSTPLPPVTLICERCNGSFERYQSEIRKNPKRRFFCSRTCSTAAHTSPLSALGVYAITHTPSGRIYVGSSKDLIRRWGYHRSALKARRHENTLLQELFDREGIQAFAFSLLESASLDMLLSVEQRWLDLYRPTGLLLNRHPIAGSPLGYTMPAEAVHRRSAALRGRHLSAETKAKISAAHMGKPSGRATFGLERRSLTTEVAAQIKMLLADGKYRALVAREMGVPDYTVGRISRGEIYSNVAPELNAAIKANRRDGRKE